MRDPSELEAEYASHNAPTQPIRRKAKQEPEAPVRNPAQMREALANERIEKEEVHENLDPRKQRKYTFQFDFTDPNTKRRYRGLFTNVILNLDTRLQASTLESQLIGGVPYQSVDPVMGNIAKGVAHMTFSLEKAMQQEPEGWANNLLALDDTSPVLALYEEVLVHERTFRGLGPDSEGGEAES